MSTAGLLNLKSGYALISDISDITAAADTVQRALLAYLEATSAAGESSPAAPTELMEVV